MRFKALFLTICMIPFVKSFAASFPMTNESFFPDYHYVLSGSPKGSDAYCANKDQKKENCSRILFPEDRQWVKIENDKGWLALDYDVCTSSTADQQCQGYQGHISVNFTPNSSKVESSDGGVEYDYDKARNVFKVIFHAKNITYPKLKQFPTVSYRGINLAGAEFYKHKPKAGEPEPVPPYYIFPTLKDGYYFAEKGMNTIRLPFSWEYLQPKLAEPITEATFQKGYGKQFVDLVNQYTNQGMIVMIDMHNYMRYCLVGPGECEPNDLDEVKHPTISRPGSPVTREHYAKAWGEIAKQFANNPKVMFDLMNEPHNMQTELILENYVAAAKAIRHVAKANNLILLEGNAWSGLAHWERTTQYNYGTANSIVFDAANIEKHEVFKDKNYAINVHEYFTSMEGGGGAEAPCIDPSSMLKVERFDDFKQWLRDQESRGYYPQVFLTEIGGMADRHPNCNADVNLFLTEIEKIPYKSSAKGGFIGWTAWAAGKGLNDTYEANLRPMLRRERDLMKTFIDHLKN